MRYILWLLTGAALALAILLAIVLLGFARLNPWLARRFARSAAAAALLAFLFEVALLTCVRRSEH
jgi:hypothetical protein